MDFSLYIHIPFCSQKCDYCDFFSVGEKDRKGKPNDVSDSYVEALLSEAEFYAERYSIKKWASVYAGGGTPGILSEKQLERLFEGLKKIAAIESGCEVTLELNPENVTSEKIEVLKKCGVNRISMGIQAYDDKALRSVNRKADTQKILNALVLLQKNWNGRLSVDFMAGLPGQTYDSFKSQFWLLDEFSGIDHVSLYTLTVEENTPLWKRIEEGKVSFSYEKADRMWCMGRNILEKKGFFQYEVSNFSRPGFEAIHNSRYWQQKNYIGAGSGASGTVYDFENKTALRWTDTLSIPAYVNFWNLQKESWQKSLKTEGLIKLEEIEEVGKIEEFEEFEKKIPRNIEEIDGDTLEFEFLMMGFRKLSGVSSADFFRRFGKSLEERIGTKDGVFHQWKKNRLASVSSKNGHKIYALNRRGILLLNRFLQELL